MRLGQLPTAVKVIISAGAHYAPFGIRAKLLAKLLIGPNYGQL